MKYFRDFINEMLDVYKKYSSKFMITKLKIEGFERNKEKEIDYNKGFIAEAESTNLRIYPINFNTQITFQIKNIFDEMLKNKK